MDESTKERVAAFESRMNVSPAALAREEITAGKRWTLLEAVGFLASGDDAIVSQVRDWCPPLNALPHHRASDSTSIHLTRALDERQGRDAECLSFEGATRLLLERLNTGSITAYVNTKPTSLAGFHFRELTYSANLIGLSPPPSGDERYWASVFVNAADVRKQRSSVVSAVKHAAVSPSMTTGAKRGPKPKWDWLNLMGELVRIADQDGIESIGGQADVERWAIAWLARKAASDDGPSESIVREHIAPVFDAIDAHNRDKRSR